MNQEVILNCMCYAFVNKHGGSNNCYYYYRYYAEGRSVTPEETSLVLVIYSDVGLMAVPVTGAYRVQVVPVPPQPRNQYWRRFRQVPDQSWLYGTITQTPHNKQNKCGYNFAADFVLDNCQ